MFLFYQCKDYSFHMLRYFFKKTDQELKIGIKIKKTTKIENKMSSLFSFFIFKSLRNLVCTTINFSVTNIQV